MAGLATRERCRTRLERRNLSSRARAPSPTIRDALRYCYRTDVHRSSRSFRWISPFWSKTPASRNDELVRTIALTGRHHKIVIPTGWLVWRRGSGAEPGRSGGIYPHERMHIANAPRCSALLLSDRRSPQQSLVPMDFSVLVEDSRQSK
jgi:hypothetical protein